MPLPDRTLEVRDPMGHPHRSLDPAAAAQMRLCGRRDRGHDLQLRFRAACGIADQIPSGSPVLTGRCLGGSVSQAGRIRAALQADWGARRGTVEPGALPDGAADRGHGSAVGQAEAHSGANRVTQSDNLPSQDSYALVAAEAKPVAAPILDYAPPMPRDRSIRIALIGAGGISFAH